MIYSEVSGDTLICCNVTLFVQVHHVPGVLGG